MLFTWKVLTRVHYSLYKLFQRPCLRENKNNVHVWPLKPTWGALDYHRLKFLVSLRCGPYLNQSFLPVGLRLQASNRGLRSSSVSSLVIFVTVMSQYSLIIFAVYWLYRIAVLTCSCFYLKLRGWWDFFLFGTMMK